MMVDRLKNSDSNLALEKLAEEIALYDILEILAKHEDWIITWNLKNWMGNDLMEPLVKAIELAREVSNNRTCGNVVLS